MEQTGGGGATNNQVQQQQHHLDRLHKLHGKHSTVIQRGLEGMRKNGANLGHQLGKWARACCCCLGCFWPAPPFGSHGGKQTASGGDPRQQQTNGGANEPNQSWSSHVEYCERQNSVRTLDLFRYARGRELAATLAGLLFMVYAASWQPISVFILAIMASLMGQYSKQTSWLYQLNQTTTSVTHPQQQQQQQQQTHDDHSALGTQQPNASQLTGLVGQPMLLQFPPHNPLSSPMGPKSPFEAYEDYGSFLGSLHSFVMPLFELMTTGPATSSGGRQALDTGGGGNNNSTTSGRDDDLSQLSTSSHTIQTAVHDILQLENDQFLRKSFQINGSAFVLALTQLTAFFLGLSLITWAARRQAARIKLLYFESCLRQEVTWFESIDSASGSGSSLNSLVDRYEDGIGMKLALLCYFLGHVGLFAATAFYQMFSLAAFCMPFVLAVGLTIAYLSERQAEAIGQHALFAKRSLQLAEEIIAAVRTVFAFNGQQKEITRYSLSFEPVYRKSLVKHLFTALNTSLSKFSIFACFAAYCFYAKRLFPPHSQDANPANKSTILAVMRGAEVSIVNILISIPFMEALQQSKGSIARIYVAIQRRSKIDAASRRGLRLDSAEQRVAGGGGGGGQWQPSISFRMVKFGYADRSGPTRRRSTLPFLNLQQTATAAAAAAAADHPRGSASAAVAKKQEGGQMAAAHRRRSLIDELTEEVVRDTPTVVVTPDHAPQQQQHHYHSQQHHQHQLAQREQSQQTNGQQQPTQQQQQSATRRQSAAVRRALELERSGQAARRILNQFNLEIEAGQSVALVGPSGSGKSTVLALVQRLYDITGGQLLIGQHNIKDLNVGWLRNQIGVVAQEPRLFDLTIAENIMLGLASDDPDLIQVANDRQLADTLAASFASQSQSTSTPGTSDDTRAQVGARIMQQVVGAARSAGAHEFIVSLPLGYATRVGSGGVQLSGGQKQRIAIARALIRRPKILLLDESTSALDTESESQVQEALRRASDLGDGSLRTTLIVAHRLETIRHVDLIVVMNEGQVVECGSHEELMRAANSGPTLYRQMYEEQVRSVARRGPASGGGGGHESGPESAAASKTSPDGDQDAAKAATLSQLAGFDGARKDSNTFGKGAAMSSSIDGGSIDGVSIDDDDYDSDADSESTSASASASASSDTTKGEGKRSRAASKRASFWQLWRFIEMPRWTALIAVLVCFLAGLILPLNLIAHSYLFSVFAYQELDQIGEYLHVFGLLILSFSTFVFIVSFLQVILPGYVGEKLSARLSVKTMDALLQKPMFYFDMERNSAGSLCDRFNSYISNLQSIAGTRVATMLEAGSTLVAGAFFGFGQSASLSLFCLSFALLVLATTIIESRLVERESGLQRQCDAQLAHLMADTLSNIKTIASLNKEQFFIARFGAILRARQAALGRPLAVLRNFLTSLKFVMPAMSWSASMYYGCKLLAENRIDLQTIFIVCPVVLFAVNDTFRALVFLPELLKARQSIKRLHRLNVEFSPQILQALTFSQQLEEQNRLHLEQLAGAGAGTGTGGRSSTSSDSSAASSSSSSGCGGGGGKGKGKGNGKLSQAQLAGAGLAPCRRDSSLSTDSASLGLAAASARPKKSISFAPNLEVNQHQQQQQQINRRLSNLAALPSYMSARRKSSRLNSLVPRASARGRIEFRAVEFAYPNRPAALVLSGFTLEVEPGESVALVGGSGSGKSTTVMILEKFYDYHAGEVRLDGRDLRLVEASWVRQQIGLVQQEPCLLSYTIADNIRYGDNSRFVSMAEVVEAAKQANIHDFIMSLPDQYDTELSSSSYSASSQLSGGQRQRIAIARALVRKAPILVFDEATSALDQRNEQIVQDALDKAKRNRTSLTIAHRLATIRNSDKIVVMREGRVVEVGAHDELMAAPGGHYRSLWELQEGAA